MWWVKQIRLVMRKRWAHGRANVVSFYPFLIFKVFFFFRLSEVRDVTLLRVEGRHHLLEAFFPLLLALQVRLSIPGHGRLALLHILMGFRTRGVEWRLRWRVVLEAPRGVWLRHHWRVGPGGACGAG